MGTLYNNEFENTKISITEQDINKIEETFKFNFPTDFKSHYLIYNGGRPKKHVFIDEGYEFIVGYFIPIKHGVNDRILERVLELFRDDQDFPNWLIPFADEPGGNLYCFSIDPDEEGAIYYWNHEIEDPEESYSYLAESLKEFIDSMVENE